MKFTLKGNCPSYSFFSASISLVNWATSSSISDGIDLDMAIDLIASKKGTTEAGINSLKDNNVLQLFEKGIISAMKRSKEISDEYK